MKRIRALVLLTFGTVLCSRGQPPLPFYWTTPGLTPDFGQQYLIQWGTNWCAPTSAADSLFWLSQNGNPGLWQWYLPGDNTGASNIISELGAYMGTDPDLGTSDGGIVAGLQDYLGLYGGGQAYNVSLTYATDVGGGLGLFIDMQTELYSGQDVLPLITWTSGEGHVVEMTGWYGADITINDPATDPYNLNWSNENLMVDTTSWKANGVAITYATGTGVIDGFVDISPVPEPGTLSLVGVGVVVFLRRARNPKNWAR